MNSTYKQLLVDPRTIQHDEESNKLYNLILCDYLRLLEMEDFITYLNSVMKEKDIISSSDDIICVQNDDKIYLNDQPTNISLSKLFEKATKTNYESPKYRIQTFYSCDKDLIKSLDRACDLLRESAYSRSKILEITPKLPISNSPLSHQWMLAIMNNDTEESVIHDMLVWQWNAEAKFYVETYQ